MKYITKVAETDEEYVSAGRLIEVACREYVKILNNHGLLKIGKFTDDGKTFSEDLFDDYYKKIVHCAKTYPSYKVHSPCVLVAKHEDGRVIGALLVTTCNQYSNAVYFSYISTLTYFRGKGIASNLHAFAEVMFSRQGASVIVGPQPDNEAAIRCARKGHEIAMKKGAMFGGEVFNGKVKLYK